MDPHAAAWAGERAQTPRRLLNQVRMVRDQANWAVLLGNQSQDEVGVGVALDARTEPTERSQRQREDHD